MLGGRLRREQGRERGGDAGGESRVERRGLDDARARSSDRRGGRVLERRAREQQRAGKGAGRQESCQEEPPKTPASGEASCGAGTCSSNTQKIL